MKPYRRKGLELMYARAYKTGQDLSLKLSAEIGDYFSGVTVDKVQKTAKLIIF